MVSILKVFSFKLCRIKVEKKLISTHYDREEATYKMEYTGGDDNDIEVGVKTPLESNGDFRNKECLTCLMSAILL